MGKLSTFVTVHNPDTGAAETFGPDSDLPGWAEKAITNPDVWASAEDTPEHVERPVPGPGQREEDVYRSGFSPDDGGDPLGDLTKAQLLAGATELEVEVSESANKSEIIAAIRGGGFDGDKAEFEGLIS